MFPIEQFHKCSKMSSCTLYEGETGALLEVLAILRHFLEFFFIHVPKFWSINSNEFMVYMLLLQWMSVTDVCLLVLQILSVHCQICELFSWKSGTYWNCSSKLSFSNTCQLGWDYFKSFMILGFLFQSSDRCCFVQRSENSAQHQSNQSKL